MAHDHQLMDTKTVPREMAQCLREDMAHVKFVMKQIENRLVQDIAEWWKGPSAKKFVSMFAGARQTLNTNLDIWMAAEIAYVKQIAWTVFQEDGEVIDGLVEGEALVFPKDGLAKKEFIYPVQNDGEAIEDTNEGALVWPKDGPAQKEFIFTN